MSRISWRRGCRDSLVSAIRAEASPLPRYEPGRGLGENWPLPQLNTETAPLHVPASTLPALVSVYEEYVDRYLDTHDYDTPPRRWLHDNVPADAGVLEFVFPLLEGPAAPYAAEILLVRLIWLIQQCPGLVPFTSPTESLVTTTVGRIGIANGRILYRFKPEGVPLVHGTLISLGLEAGHIRVFNKAMSNLYARLGAEGRRALVMLATRTRTKALLRLLYDDGLVTGAYLGKMRSIDDKVLSVEMAVLRSKTPAETLCLILVPEYLTASEFRTLFDIPWKRQARDAIKGTHLIRKMPLVRKILESA